VGLSIAGQDDTVLGRLSATPAGNTRVRPWEPKLQNGWQICEC
jgi:hypothetical protein